MNERTTDAQLDQLLQSWSDQHVLDDEHIEVLRQRIISQWEVEARPARESVLPAAIATSADSNVFWRSAALVSMTVAALLVVALLVVSSAKRDESMPRTASRTNGQSGALTLPPDFVWLDDDRLASKRTLMREMERLFSDRLTWVVETNGQVEVGLVEDDQLPDTSAKALAIRIVVVRKSPDNPAGTPVWAADLVTRNEQFVSISPSEFGDVRFSLWAFVMPDGNVAVDTDLDLRGSHALHPTTSMVQELGKPHVLHSQRQGKTEYLIYQTVSLL